MGEHKLPNEKRIKGFRDVPLNSLSRMARMGYVMFSKGLEIGEVEVEPNFNSAPTEQNEAGKKVRKLYMLPPNEERRLRKATGLSPRQYKKMLRKAKRELKQQEEANERKSEV